LAIFVLLGPAAHAQQVLPQLPPGAEPGRELPQPVLPQPSGPAAPIVVPSAPAARAPEGAERFRFVLAEIEIRGATAFQAEELRGHYADLLGREISVAELFQVAGAIEVRYREAGFITSRVIVPEQTIEDGRFRIDVVEGFVSDIVYGSEVGPAAAAIARLLEPLRAVRPVSVGEIERRLLLANDLPGMTVRGSLQAAEGVTGGSVIVVEAERKAFDAALTVDDRNTRYVGQAQASLAAALNAFGSRADTLFLNARLSHPVRHARAVGVTYTGLFSEDGLTAGLNASYAESEPGLELDPLEVESRVRAAIGTVAYPVIRSRLQNLRAVGELEYRDIDTQLAGTDFNRDRLRVARAGLSYDLTDTWDGITAVRGMLHQGLDLLNATAAGAPLASRANGNGDFTKLTVDVTRVQRLPGDFSLFATLTTQFAFDPLLASEEIALGGPSFGRAYDPGEVASDSGIAGLIELRYAPPLALLPLGVQFYAFVDAGKVWSESNDAGLGADSVASVGIGVRANLHEHLYGSLELNRPLDGPVRTEDDKPTRLFVSLTAQF